MVHWRTVPIPRKTETFRQVITVDGFFFLSIFPRMSQFRFIIIDFVNFKMTTREKAMFVKGEKYWNAAALNPY